MNRRYRKTIIAGNWKMNKTPSETKAFAEQFKAILPKTKWCDIVVCVPTVDLSAAVRAFKDSRIAVGAENVYFEKSGAYTGEISADMLADLGEVARVAEEWSMPLLAMLYARGPRISNEFDPAVVAHCARVGVELGADIVKVPYTGDIDSFADVIAGCCVPVVIAGGPRTETTRQFLEMVDNSLKAGGSGLSVGRNVFQHPKRVQLVRALRGLVHQGLSLDEALAIVEG